MIQNRFNLRFDKKEKEQLNIAVRKNGMTVTNYIKYRLFYNNPDINDEKFIYESPEKDKHNYLLMGILQDVYLMVLHLASLNKNDEEIQELKDLCHIQAKKNITNYGYLKVTTDE